MLKRANILWVSVLLVVAGLGSANASIDPNQVELRPAFAANGNWLQPKFNLASSGSAIAGNPTVTVLEANLKPAPVAVPRASNYGLFGSVALPISSLPAGRNWTRVSATDFTSQYGAHCNASACSGGVGLMLKKAALMAEAKPTMDALSLINSSVNNLIRYRADASDKWATPIETAASGTGDCEDYAIAKMWLLRSIGYRADQLQLVVLRDTRTTAFHAVLAVHVGETSYILDNISSRVLPDTMLKNYVPIESFAGNRMFIHGFARKPVQTASLPTS
jgi:predicted transglutaminase-like cysteine proteinase